MTLRLGGAALVAVVLGTTGCDEPKQVGQPQGPSGQSSADDQANGPAGGSEANVPAGGDARGRPDAGVSGGKGSNFEFTEDDFVEANIRNRDPFRSYAEVFEVEAPKNVQRKVKMPETSVEQMRLIAIISGVRQPRAMMTDPSGVGHVVERGDYVGRAEVIQTEGSEGMPVTLNWRVHRIRSEEVVLARKDPTAPEDPPLTRVIPLYDEKQED